MAFHLSFKLLSVPGIYSDKLICPLLQLSTILCLSLTALLYDLFLPDDDLLAMLRNLFIAADSLIVMLTFFLIHLIQVHLGDLSVLSLLLVDGLHQLLNLLLQPLLERLCQFSGFLILGDLVIDDALQLFSSLLTSFHEIFVLCNILLKVIEDLEFFIESD